MKAQAQTPALPDPIIKRLDRIEEGFLRLCRVAGRGPDSKLSAIIHELEQDWKARQQAAEDNA